MFKLNKIAAAVMIMGGSAFAANYFNYNVDFESDRVGFPPTISPSTAGQVNTHIGYAYLSAPADTLTVQQGYTDSVNSAVFGTGNVLVCRLTNDTRLQFPIPVADVPTKGTDMQYSIEWDMMIDSSLNNYENAGYIVHDSTNAAIYVTAITAGWYSPGGTSSITIYDYTTSTSKVFWVSGKGVPMKIKMLFDIKNWKVDLFVKGNKLGTFGCNPAANGIGQLQINPYQAVASTVAFDNIYLGKIPTNCAEQILSGKIMQGDLKPDCEINFADFALFAQKWLMCNNAAGVTCP
jgi:hypothetical protein